MAKTVASDALGVPIRVLLGDAAEVFGRAHYVRNTVEADQNAPTLAEVRELLEAPPEAEAASVADASEVTELAAERLTETVAVE
jgi:hypothetical protein